MVINFTGESLKSNESSGDFHWLKSYKKINSL